MHTGESNFSNFGIEYLSKIETGAHMGLNHEKNGSQKSRDTLPLKGVCHKFFKKFGLVDFAV